MFTVKERIIVDQGRGILGVEERKAKQGKRGGMERERGKERRRYKSKDLLEGR